ncbi:MAG: peptidoglycan editing factor PgeF [Afipia sp.]|nr:peptidoglycan editing factor PgeF [Afipia sp.]
MLKPLTHELLAPFPHGFFDRLGGVSTGIYGSLNCGLRPKDQRDAVLENRDRVARHLGSRGDRLLTCYQIHSAEAIIVTAPWAPDQHPKADALVTATPGLVLGALGADCMPILFSDFEAGIVGAAHAGWKGALAGVGESTIAAMERIGANRQRITAVIGPCISQRAYEVGPEFLQTFIAANPANENYFVVPTGRERPTFNLPSYMLDRLKSAGIANVTNLEVCTYSAPEQYFSYRRATHRKESGFGEQIAAIMVC